MSLTRDDCCYDNNDIKNDYNKIISDDSGGMMTITRDD